MIDGVVTHGEVMKSCCCAPLVHNIFLRVMCADCTHQNSNVSQRCESTSLLYPSNIRKNCRKKARCFKAASFK